MSVYEAMERLPEHLVGEVIGGELYVSRRPALRDSGAVYIIGALLGPFDLGQQGVGGWRFGTRPELHLGADVLRPNLGGWRRERPLRFPLESEVLPVPAWVFEVCSASTEALLRDRKMPVYAREGVEHLWLVDSRVQSLEVYRLENQGWTRLGTYTGDAVVRAEPFEALPLELALAWRD